MTDEQFYGRNAWHKNNKEKSERKKTNDKTYRINGRTINSHPFAWFIVVTVIIMFVDQLLFAMLFIVADRLFIVNIICQIDSVQQLVVRFVLQRRSCVFYLYVAHFIRH